MKIKKGMILAAGFGKRMMPMTKKIPKPLISIGKISLLENCLIQLRDFGVNEIVINTHYLSEEMKKYISEKNFSLKIKIYEEKKILDTGGGILNATNKFGNEPFIVINPDTIWKKNHIKELQYLEKKYFTRKSTSILLVDKNRSYDKSFRGDFNLDEKGLVTRDKANKMIYTGAQIMDQSIFKNYKVEPFSINKIWDQLIKKKSLYGLESNQDFLHINSIEIYKKIIKENFIY